MFGSHPARVRAPDVLVHLQLHPNVHSAFGDPIRQFSQVNLAPGRRDQDRAGTPFEIVLSDHLEREVPVSAISDHELYFVQIGSQQIKIGPMISFSLSRARTLDIQDYLRSLVHLPGRDIATGFNQDFVFFVAKLRNQRPPVNVYSLSHQAQRIGQPVNRTKVQGRPACVDSPWIERKISVTRSTLGF